MNYGNLTQILLPANAQVNLETLDPDASIVDIVDHETHRAIVAFMDIPYDTSNRIQYEYITTERVRQLGKYRVYNLLVAKQPGAKTEEVEVQIMIPLGATFISATPAITTSYVLDQEIIEFRLSLAGDTRIELIFQME